MFLTIFETYENTTDFTSEYMTDHIFESRRKMYMLFTGREVRMGKNCARGLEYGPRPKADGRTQDQGHSFFPYGPT